MVRVIIVLESSCIEDKVLKSCAANGFKLTNHLTNIGIICGHIPTDRLDDIRSIPGISSVELDQQCEILPTNSKEA